MFCKLLELQHVPISFTDIWQNTFFLTGLLMETLLKQRLMLSKLAELHEDQDQLSDFLIAKS